MDRIDEYFAHVIDSQSKRAEGIEVPKPVVKFALTIHPPKKGDQAVVIPVDHPARYLNGVKVRTSTVVAVDADGINFETLNTRYEFSQM
jgi:hypothetical protein